MTIKSFTAAAPLKRIAFNAGLEPGIVAEKGAQPFRRPRPECGFR
jgi:hypothetical protein